MTVKLYLIITLIVLSISSSYGQNDFATVNIYRPKMMYGSGARHHFIINGEKVCTLKSGGHLEYKVFNSDSLTIGVYAVALGTRGKLTKYHVNVEKGNEYYFKVRPKFNSVLMEEIEEPVLEKKLDYRLVEKHTDKAESLTINIESKNAESNSKESNADKLRELKKLLDDGIITQEDFDKKKEELLREY
ncbi:SHOCT domain-containing protein [Pseudofulvibacter geojedonensis]|uniref:SHOCT domain-containing protein n=1 Tax=Pseudofulvibacter geojedonensis TaxID=1123758 RepID=UPI0036712AD9